MTLRGPLRIVLIILGLISFAVGAAGAVLPVLPTTPFMLISAYCFVRSSDRLHKWLMSHRRFGPVIRRVQEGKGITLRVKLSSLGAAYLLVGITIVLVSSPHLRIFLVLLLTAKTVFMIKIPTCPADEGCEPEKQTMHSAAEEA